MVGRASSRLPRSPKASPFLLELLALSAFFASARLRAIASLILTGVFGTGGSSWGRGLRRDLDGVWGEDFVRTRVGETIGADGFDGESARVRDAGGIRAFAFDGVRARGGGGTRDIWIENDKLNVNQVAVGIRDVTIMASLVIRTEQILTGSTIFGRGRDYVTFRLTGASFEFQTYTLCTICPAITLSF